MRAAGLGGGFFNRGGLLRMSLGDGDLLTGSDFALNRGTRGGILSFWSRGVPAVVLADGRVALVVGNSTTRTATPWTCRRRCGGSGSR